MKNFINGFGTCFAIASAIFLIGFMYDCYPMEKGYSAEYRARLDDLIAGIEPISVADFGDAR